MLYEVADDRDLPAEARGEDGRMAWRMRARHRLREPETAVDRASDEQIVALLRPLPSMPACSVAACTRPADGAGGYCNTHYQRGRAALAADSELDPHRWRARESGVAEPGQLNLRALPVLVVVEVLFGVQQRVRGGAKITDAQLRSLCDGLRQRQVASIASDRAEITRNKSVRSLRAAFTQHVRRALADPRSEQAKDIWDLAVFGHRGNLSFTGISQPWLAQSVKRWAAEQLPRHRGRGAARVRGKINALRLLSEFLARRPDRGLIASALGRSDIEDFLNRLAHLESIGEISRYRRNCLCRDVREAVALPRNRLRIAAVIALDRQTQILGDVRDDPILGSVRINPEAGGDQQRDGIDDIVVLT
jgi:hypothetical protein